MFNHQYQAFGPYFTTTGMLPMMFYDYRYGYQNGTPQSVLLKSQHNYHALRNNYNNASLMGSSLAQT
jgi:hypothetical protein